jgi:hypothetical protein
MSRWAEVNRTLPVSRSPLPASVRRLVTVVATLAMGAPPAQGQLPPSPPGSSNIHVLAHVPLGGSYTVADIEIEQELSRPYAYVQRDFGLFGFNILELKDPSKPRVIYTWNIESPELHTGRGGSDGHYFKQQGRYYYVQSFHFGQSGPDSDVGAIFFDVTGLPDTSKVREVRRMRAPDLAGGFHTLFPYKHSDGRVILFTTTRGNFAQVYDVAPFLAGDANQGFLSRIPGGPQQSYHDYYVAFDPATRQDKFYGAAYAAGYFIYDVTRPETPRLLTSITGAAGIDVAHTISASPDGRWAIAQTEYQYSPLRVWDLKPGLDGTVKTISRPIGAWAADWKLANHNHEMRWPYVFVGSFEDGFQVLNMMDPTNPYTVGYYSTLSGTKLKGLNLTSGTSPSNPVKESDSIFNGAWGVDVRNADGLIVVSDFRTGFWAFKMDGFDGWNGHQWGMPNISSVQDWDNGPEGAPKPGRVS